jgi:hypothetical protein
MFSNIQYEANVLSYMTCIRSFIHNIFSNFSLFSNSGWTEGTCHEASHVSFPIANLLSFDGVHVYPYGHNHLGEIEYLEEKK